MNVKAPRLFISYSWTSSNHQEWVLALATQLRESGVDAILDKWDLKEGQDANAFMERMVTDPEISKVILVCDKQYAEKANGRSGGVGTETQIISPEMYAKQEQTKFVAVPSERADDGSPYLPAYYKSRIYIDLSIPESYSASFEQLVRWAFDKPLHVKPDLGSPPAFLSETAGPSLQTSVMSRRAIEAIRDGRPYAEGALKEYLDVYAGNLERLRLDSSDQGEFEDRVLRSIEDFQPYRDELLSITGSLINYRSTIDTWRLCRRSSRACCRTSTGRRTSAGGEIMTSTTFGSSSTSCSFTSSLSC